MAPARSSWGLNQYGILPFNLDVDQTFIAAILTILGICFGTYASLFIGTPVMFDATAWNNRRKAARKK